MQSAKWASVDNECQRKPVSPILISKQNRRGSTLKPLASCFECGVCGGMSCAQKCVVRALKLGYPAYVWQIPCFILRHLAYIWQVRLS